MIASRPHAFVIDCDDATRRPVTAWLGEIGFVVADFAVRERALAALAERRVDLAVIAGPRSGGADDFALSRRLRRRQPGLKVLLVADPGDIDIAPRHRDVQVVARPAGRSHFRSAVFELLIRDVDDASDHDAELGLVEAEIACLRGRQASAERNGVATAAEDLGPQIRDALAARQCLLRGAGAMPLH